jgi:excisionase family DNA binding protein
MGDGLDSKQGRDQGNPGNGQEFMTEFMTIEELAHLLKVPKGWIYARTRERSPNTLPFYKVGKYLRFRLGEVQGWLDQQHRGWQEGQ